MSDRPPTSVLLPTTRRADACAELAAQLGNSDELLVIHDGEDDPVTEWDDLRWHFPEALAGLFEIGWAIGLKYSFVNVRSWM